MAATERWPVSLSLFKPLVVVDVVDGQWFASVTVGTNRIEVTDWPLKDSQLLVDPSSVIHIELLLADSKAHFLRGEGRKFSDLYIPMGKVRESDGGVFRSWMGLQRDFRIERVTPQAVADAYEVSLSLAQNLLTPKVCCSILNGQLADGNKSGSGALEGMLEHSVKQHCNIISHLHQQLATLWVKGKLRCSERLNGEFTAHLSDTPIDDEFSLLMQGAADAEQIGQLKDQVITLQSRLQESERIRHAYRDRLLQHGEDVEDEEADDDFFSGANSLVRMDEALHQQANQFLEVERSRRDGFQEEAVNVDGMLGVDQAMRSHDGQRRRVTDEQQHNASPLDPFEVELLRSAERHHRAQLLELHAENDRIMREKLQHEAEVSVLREELRDKTKRLAEESALRLTGKSRTLLWAASDGDAPPSNPLEVAQLKAENRALRRDVEQLQRERTEAAGARLPNRLAASSPSAGSSSSPKAANAAVSASAYAGATLARSQVERMQLVQEELRRDPRAPLTEREQRLCTEAESLAAITDRLQEDLERCRALHTEESKRRAAAEREADQAASEALLKVQDKESNEIKLQQEIRTLRSEEISRQRAAQATAQVEMEAMRRELDAEHQRRQAAERECAQMRARLQEESQALAVEQARRRNNTNHKAPNANHLPKFECPVDINTKEAFQAELARREKATRKLVAELRAEILELEEANDSISQQSQKQFDEMALLQERTREDILKFEKHRSQEQDWMAHHHGELEQYREANTLLHQDLQMAYEQIEYMKNQGEHARMAQVQARSWNSESMLNWLNRRAQRQVAGWEFTPCEGQPNSHA